ncbi:amino acid adenylation domain-containing protein [Marinicrinis sediminis]|uniref:Amino acid adenylation domain-containing protein n=1 Tax=Marinicrinis sediminis TaxID=1652465 RepID=A0ABW5R6L9_9BACL
MIDPTMRATEAYQRSEAYWLSRLTGLETKTHLPSPFQVKRSVRTHQLTAHLSEELIASIQRVSRGKDISAYVFLLGAYYVWLHAHTDQEEVAVTVPVLAMQEGQQPSPSSCVVIPFQLDAQEPFRSLLGRLQQQLKEDWKHPYFPVDELVRSLHLTEPSELLASTMFGMTSIHGDKEMEKWLHLEDMELRWQLAGSEQGYQIQIAYDEGRFDEATIRSFVDRYIRLLSELLDEERKGIDRSIGELSVIDRTEAEQWLQKMNQTQAPYDEEGLMYQRFEQQAEQHPQQIAIYDGRGKMTYETLNERANQWAHLLREAGVGPGTYVAVLLERSAEMVIAVLAVLKAGGAYVPMEPGYPKGRVASIMQELQIRYVLTQFEVAKPLQSLFYSLDAMKAVLYMDVHASSPPVETLEMQTVEQLWDHIAERSYDSVTAGGFVSSYDGRPFSEQEVHQYHDHVMGIMAPHVHEKAEVLEIGCGAGLLTFSLCKRVQRVRAMDPSGETLRRNQNYADQHGLDQVEWMKGFAHELAELPLEASSMDVIVLASTVQFFPGFHYLSAVITELEGLLKPGGVLILADLLDLNQKTAYIESVHHYEKAHPEASGSKQQFDGELYVHERMLQDILKQTAQLELTECIYRNDAFQNELQYRFDAVIRKKGGSHAPLESNEQSEADLSAANLIQADLIQPDLGQSDLIRPELNQPESIQPNMNMAEDLNRTVHDSNAKGLPSLRWFTRGQAEQMPKHALAPAATSAHPAYCIFTSGSTGKPKGVIVQHRPVMNLLAWAERQFAFDSRDCVLFITSLCFDLSVFDLFGMLSFGGSIRMVKEEEIREPQRLLDILYEEPITFWDSAPAALQQLVPFMESERCRASRRISKLRLVFLSGDWIPLTLPEALKQTFDGVQVVSLGGATEATVWSNFYPIDKVSPDWASIPYGRPIQNARYYILNTRMEPCPVHVPGELYIGGECLAAGYTDVELTKERFVPDPFGTVPDSFATKVTDPQAVAGAHSEAGSSVMYRTGDLARWGADGNIEFLGRMDHQVKIRGYRIELGEIQAQLMKHDRMKWALVLDRVEHGGTKYLCAYYLCTGSDPGESELKACLGQQLPAYMIPSRFVRLDDVPVTPNGKLDRKALPDPLVTQAERESACTPPRNETEKEVAAIFEQVLGMPPGSVRVEDSFFELGGHSLSATTLIAAVYKQMQVQLALRDVFETATVEQLAKRLERKEKSEVVVIKPAPVSEVYPVTSSQKRLYILNELEGAQLSYNMPQLLELEGTLDLDRLERACRQLLERHESLRTSFEMQGDQFVQRVHEQVELTIERFSLEAASPQIETNRGASDLHAGMRQQMEQIVQQFVRPFDLGQAPLLRVGWVAIGANRAVLMMDMHHIVSDGVSMQLLIADTMALYQGETLDPLPLQYKDVAVWQQAQMESDLMKQHEAYWLQQYADDVPVLHLPTDFPRPPVQSFKGSAVRFTLDAKVTDRLRSLAAHTGATIYMVLLAGYTAWLSRYSGQDDIVVGSPIAGRSHGDVARIIGMFVNTLAVRTAPRGELSFCDYVEQVRDLSLATYEHQAYPFERLVEKLELQRNLSRNPLFDTMFTLQNMDQVKLEMDGMTIRPYEMTHQIAKVDLNLTVVEEADQLSFFMEYCTDLFREETVKRMMHHFCELLKDAAASPEKALSQLTMLTQEETRQLLVDFNQTATEYDREKTVHARLEEQAMRNPQATAICFEEKALSYQELNEAANRVAHGLLERGAGPGMIVGVMCERSLDMLVGLYGVMKSGAAYLPIDPAYPEERVKVLLADSDASLLLVQSHLTDRVSFDGFDGEVLLLGADAWIGYSATQPEQKVTSGDLAYVIYTSGSTGQPKGVMIEHRAVMNFMTGMAQRIPFAEHASIASLTTMSFDIFVLETLLPLSRGMKVVLASEEEAVDGLALEALNKRHSFEMMQTTPSRMTLLMERDRQATWLGQLKVLMLGGEPMSMALLERLRERTNARIFNMYGPTETTVWSSVEELTDATTITIGRPIANTQMVIVNEWRQLQPAGVAGELCIAGDGLARGYWKRETLTAEKFVPFPWSGDEVSVDEDLSSKELWDQRRMYHTGDLARWLPDGRLEHMGRIDHQVKIRGFRIELGEIEAMLLRHEAVREAVVIQVRDSQGESALAAYLVLHDRLEKDRDCEEAGSMSDSTVANEGPHEGEQGDQGDRISWRGYLTEWLPQYMIPAFFTVLTEMPLTPNGKVDRKALPNPQQGDEERVVVQPRNETEAVLAEVWANVLKLEEVSVMDSFFDLGGSSMKFIHVSSRLAERGRSVTIQELFQYVTIAELAPHVKQVREREMEGYETGEVAIHPNHFHSFSDSEEKREMMWGEVSAIRFPDRLDPSWIEQVLRILMNRHDILQLRSIRTADGWKQRIVEWDGSVPFEVIDIRHIPQEERMERLADMAWSMESALDVQEGPLLLFRLLDGGDQEPSTLVYAMHHFCFDQISIHIFMKEFMLLIQQQRENRTFQLPPRTATYMELMKAMQAYADSDACREQMDYWLPLANGEGVDIPLEMPVSACTEWTIGMTQHEIDIQGLLKELNRQPGIQLNDVLIYAFLKGYQKWSGQTQLMMNLFDTGRYPYEEGLELSNTIGWMAGKYPVRFELSGSDSILDELRDVARQRKQIPQDNSYSLLRYAHQDDHIRAQMQHIRDAQVNFNFIGQFDEEMHTDWLHEVTPIPLPEKQKVNSSLQDRDLLNVGSQVQGQRLHLYWFYIAGLISRESIDQLASWMHEEIERVGLELGKHEGVGI